MGLFNKANNLLSNESEFTIAGVQKNKKIEKTPAFESQAFHKNILFAFSDFIKKYKIQAFAIFELTGNYYTVKDSLGLNGKTIANFSVEQEEFNSIFKMHKNIVSVNINDFDFLSNVFCNMKELFDTLSFCKISSNYIMFCDCEISDHMLDDFQKIDNSNKLDYEMIYQDYSENENSCIAKIDFEEAIETFVCTNATKQLSKTIFVKSIFTEICNRFMFWYNSPFFCKQNDNYSLNLFIPSKIELPNELLLTHIIFNLKDILDNCAEIINIEIFKINQKEDIQKILES